MSLQRVGHYLETEQQQQQLFFIFAVKTHLLHTGVQSQDHTVLHVKIFQLQPVGWTEAYDLGLDCQSIPSPGQVKEVMAKQRTLVRTSGPIRPIPESLTE